MPPPLSSSPFGPQPVPIVLRNVLIGCGAASFWRGAWYILDDNLFPNDPTWSASTSLLGGVAGMLLSQGLIKRYEVLMNHRTADQLLFRRSVYRFGAIYCSALSVVLVWRGAWLSWDCFYEGLHSKQAWHASKSSFLHHSVYHQMHQDNNPIEVDATATGHATRSGLFSHLTAVALLLGMGTFASVLAPPAAVSILHDATIKSSVRAVQKQTTRRPPPRHIVSESSSSSSSSKRRLAATSHPTFSGSSCGSKNSTLAAAARQQRRRRQPAQLLRRARLLPLPIQKHRHTR